MRSVRRPAVAGLFYPSEPRALADMVDEFLLAGASDLDETRPTPKAIVAPHAGYVYSGAVAGRAYARVQPARGRITRAVILGPCHRVPVHGLALPGADAMATPLGELRVESIRHESVVRRADVHRDEHSIEVQLPFLHRALGQVTVVPLAVGDASASEVANVLDEVWGGDETLIVISSDLSHYLPYEAAQRVDAATAEAVLACRPVRHDQACGATPLDGLLHLARARHLAPELLGLCNSGDTAGDKARVVGYGAFGFWEAA